MAHVEQDVRPAIDAGSGHAGTRIDLDGVTKQYRVGEVEITAIDAIDLHVDEAAFVVILGPSGCGDTTLLNVIGALDVPTSGSVRVGEVELAGASPARRAEVRRHTISFIFQTFNLFPGLTAHENVRFGAAAAAATTPIRGPRRRCGAWAWTSGLVTSPPALRR